VKHNSTQLVPWYCLATFLLNLPREVLESWTTVFLEWRACGIKNWLHPQA
jgi:hypothetical protein